MQTSFTKGPREVQVVTFDILTVVKLTPGL